MNVEAIKTAVASTATQAKQLVVEKGTVYASWVGRQITNIAGVAKNAAIAVANWVKGFFKNFPQYLATAKQYFNVGINYIRNHQYPVAVGAGIAAAATLVIYGLAKYLGGE